MFKQKARVGGYSTLVIKAKDLEDAGFAIQSTATGEKSKPAADLVNARAAYKASQDIQVYAEDSKTLTGLRANVTKKFTQSAGKEVERICFTVTDPETDSYATIYTSFANKTLDSNAIVSAIVNATNYRALDEMVETTKTRNSGGEYIYVLRAKWESVLEQSGDDTRIIDMQPLIFNAGEADLATNYTAAGVDINAGDSVKKELVKDIQAFDENGALTQYKIQMKIKAFKKLGNVSKRIAFTVKDAGGFQVVTLGGFISDISKPCVWYAKIYSTQNQGLLGKIAKVEYTPPSALGADGMYKVGIPNYAADDIGYPYSFSNSIYVSTSEVDDKAFRATLVATSEKADVAGLNAEVSQSLAVRAYEENDKLSQTVVAVSGNSYNLKRETIQDLALNLNNAGYLLDERIAKTNEYYGIGAGFHVPKLATFKRPILAIVSDSTNINRVGTNVSLEYLRDRVGSSVFKITTDCAGLYDGYEACR